MSKTGFAASSANAFIRSRAHARGRYAAGVKTIHTCLPHTGFGNVVHADGSCSTDPSIKWLYTKKTVTVSYSYQYDDFQYYSLASQQSFKIAYDLGLGYVEKDYPPDDPNYPGRWMVPSITATPFTPGAYFIGDASVSNYPDAIPVERSNVTETKEQYYPYFDQIGINLSVHHTSSGALDTGGLITNIDSNGVISMGFLTYNNTPPAYSNLPARVGFEHPTNYVTEGTCFQSCTGQSQTFLIGTPTISLGSLLSGNPMILATTSATITITTVYSLPISIGDLEGKAATLLGATNLLKTNERYSLFDAPSIQLNWNPVNQAPRYDVYRAELIGGVLGAYSLIGSVHPDSNYNGSYTDTTALPGHTYYYTVGSISPQSAPIVITVTPPSNPVLAPFVFTPSLPTPTGGPPTGLIATFVGSPLIYTTIDLALNPNSQIILFPIDDTGSFVISSRVSCGSPVPLYLAGRAMEVTESPLSVGVNLGGLTGSRAFIWSKSRGFLTGNSPNHVPPFAGYQQKYYFKPGIIDGGGASVDITAAFPPMIFPHGRGGKYNWQLTEEIPKNAESFYFSDVPSYGYLYWT